MTKIAKATRRLVLAAAALTVLTPLAGPVGAQEVYDEPVYQEPAADQPVYEEPVYTEDTSYQDPVYTEDASYTEDTSYSDPAVDQPVYEEPVYEDPAVTEDTSYTEDPTYTEDTTYTEDPTYTEDATYTEDTVVDAPVYEEAVAETPAYDPANVIATAWIAGTNGDGAACRSDASFDAGIVGTLWDGQAVDVIGDTVGEWQPVACNGQAAFIHASFLTWEQPSAVSDNAAGGSNVTTSNRKRDRTNEDTGSTEPAPPAASGGSSQGQAMADFALQYVGYPYVYAGEGPHAFDCSGFTMYVAKQVLGMDITHDMFYQVTLGTQVSRDELQPGDLVFFQNTFRDGLSHTGIYIGNGQFVHAENENTGVVVTDLNSDYYSSRWYGAVRLT